MQSNKSNKKDRNPNGGNRSRRRRGKNRNHADPKKEAAAKVPNERNQDKDVNKSKERDRDRDQETVAKPKPPSPAPVPIKKRYGVIFYETHAAAKKDLNGLREKARNVDQLNIVIRAEGDMDDPELLQFGKVFAGAAWALIHDRRVEEGWYNEPR